MPEDLSAFRVRRGLFRVGRALALPCWAWAAVSLLTAVIGWWQGTPEPDPIYMRTMAMMFALLGVFALAFCRGVLGWIAGGFTSTEAEYQRRLASEWDEAPQ